MYSLVKKKTNWVDRNISPYAIVQFDFLVLGNSDSGMGDVAEAGAWASTGVFLTWAGTLLVPFFASAGDVGRVGEKMEEIDGSSVGTFAERSYIIGGEGHLRI